VKVTENPILNRVAFEGNKKIDDDKLRDEVQSKPRQVFTRARVQSDVERILSIYRRGGRYNAVVEPKIIRLEQGRVDLVFEIDEGDVTGIKRISFVGNEHYGDGTLRGKIRTTESAWWRFLSSDDRFDPTGSISIASCCASFICRRVMPTSASSRRSPSCRPTATASSSPSPSARASATSSARSR
jgi:outer membrane protein assembly factor BamA